MAMTKATAKQVTVKSDATGGVVRSLHDKLSETVSVKDFGAVGDGVTDDTAAIQAALASSDDVYIPEGSYAVGAMIQIEANQRLTIAPSTLIKRLTSISSSTDPVFWLRGQKSSLIGGGPSTQIETENKCPTGVIRIGHENMSVSHANANWITLRDCYIRGNTSGGQTTGNPDSAVYMANPQFSGLTSYFHWISGLQLGYANYGIRMRGWVNACHITDIHVFRCGNATIRGSAIYFEGAQENTVKGLFHHNSVDAYSVTFDDLDNTGSGGSDHVPSWNMLDGIVCEQGGTTERALYVPSSCSGVLNRIRIHSNTTLGDDVFVGFIRDNDYQNQNITRTLRDYAFAAYNGSADTLKDSFGIASVTKLAGGYYRFNFDAALSDTNYMVQASVTDRGVTSAITTINVTAKTTSYFEVKVVASNNTTIRTVVDADDVNVLIKRVV